MKLKTKLKFWIAIALQPTRVSIYKHSSYGLKHIAERAIGQYVSNTQMKQALRRAGYKPINRNELNHRYRLTIRRQFRKKIHDPKPWFSNDAELWNAYDLGPST